MKIFVAAKPNAKEERVERINETHFTVAVKEPPREGRANAAVLQALAHFLRIASSNMRIVAGRTSRKKVIEVLD